MSYRNDEICQAPRQEFLGSPEGMRKDHIMKLPFFNQYFRGQVGYLKALRFGLRAQDLRIGVGPVRRVFLLQFFFRHLVRFEEGTYLST